MKDFSLLVPWWEVKVGVCGIRTSLTISAHSLGTPRTGAGIDKDGHCLNTKCVLTVYSDLWENPKLSYQSSMCDSPLSFSAPTTGKMQ